MKSIPRYVPGLGVRGFILTGALRLRNCVGNLNTDPLHKIGVLHRCI